MIFKTIAVSISYYTDIFYETIKIPVGVEWVKSDYVQFIKRDGYTSYWTIIPRTYENMRYVVDVQESHVECMPFDDKILIMVNNVEPIDELKLTTADTFLKDIDIVAVKIDNEPDLIYVSNVVKIIEGEDPRNMLCCDVLFYPNGNAKIQTSWLDITAYTYGGKFIFRKDMCDEVMGAATQHALDLIYRRHGDKAMEKDFIWSLNDYEIGDDDGSIEKFVEQFQ